MRIGKMQIEEVSELIFTHIFIFGEIVGDIKYNHYPTHIFYKKFGGTKNYA